MQCWQWCSASIRKATFSTAGVDRLLVIEGEAFEGYAPEQLVQGLRAVDNQFTPRHWLLPDSRTGGGELGRRLGAGTGRAPGDAGMAGQGRPVHRPCPVPASKTCNAPYHA
ncbi:electron transfer flavoprotein subunit alpha [Pseudomonas putida S11]|nr:electron transfer flavoprotein subunit alpha [Pseudomonas putida S11]